MQQLELEKLGSSPGYVCVSGKDTHFSEPQFLHLKNGTKADDVSSLPVYPLPSWVPVHISASGTSQLTC